MSENNDKYVLRHEFERNTGKIYEKINENDRKHTEAISSLNNKVDKQTLIQQQTYESQKKQESHLEKISDKMSDFVSEVNDLRYEVKGHDDQLKNFSQILTKKQTFNVGIATAIVAGIFSLLTAAVGLAPILFN
ncbi:hypothetical protein AB4M78_08655 [Staphylococcus pasteuri]|uniref:hypothetical protein n=1 Tax=Staphylococcus pasteuri TaxID=45972 RepID=UPI0034C648EA